MLDDDFKDIENFLKTSNNPHLSAFQDMEVEISQRVTDDLSTDPKERFIQMNALIQEAYGHYAAENETAMFSLGIAIIVLKMAFNTFKEDHNTIITSVEDQEAYIALMKKLSFEIQKEIEYNISTYNIYINFMTTLSDLLQEEL